MEALSEPSRSDATLSPINMQSFEFVTYIFSDSTCIVNTTLCDTCRKLWL